MPSDTAAINDVWTECASSLNAGDIDRWLSYFTEDAVSIPQNEPPLVGKDQIRIWIKAMSDQVTFDMDVTNEEVEVAGDWAFSRGTYTLTLTPKESGRSDIIDGRYITILTRQPDGSWKRYREIFNYDAAPGGK